MTQASRSDVGPEFSVIIVSRNRSAMLAEAIPKVQALSEQAGSYELVVVDNGSSDDTWAVLAGLQADRPRPFIAVQEPQAGISRARNTGVRVASGRWLLFIDDDAWVPDDLLLQYRHWLDQYPDTLAWGGGATLRYPKKLPWCWGVHFDGMLSALDLGDTPRVLHFPETPYGLNMLFRREVLEQLGGFREAIAFGGDETDVFLRMAERGMEVRYAPGCMVVHAVEPERFSLRWLLGAAYRSGGFHANLDYLNGGLCIGWQMVSAGWPKVLLGRRGCIPVALVLYALRVIGYRRRQRSLGRGDD